MRINQRLEHLERHWGQDSVSVLIREKRTQSALSQKALDHFLTAFPDEVIDDVLLKMEETIGADTAIHKLLEKVIQGLWKPVRLPMSIVRILLNDSDARINHMCSNCGIVVPTSHSASKKKNRCQSKCPNCASTKSPFLAF